MQPLTDRGGVFWIMSGIGRPIESNGIEKMEGALLRVSTFGMANT